MYSPSHEVEIIVITSDTKFWAFSWAYSRLWIVRQEESGEIITLWEYMQHWRIYTQPYITQWRIWVVLGILLLLNVRTLHLREDRDSSISLWKAILILKAFWKGRSHLYSQSKSCKHISLWHIYPMVFERSILWKRDTVSQECSHLHIYICILKQE